MHWWKYWVLVTEKVQVKQNWNASFNVCKILQNWKKLARVWVERCQACCGLCHQDQTCRPLALFCKPCVVIITQTRPSLDLVTSAGEEEGGRMRTWRSADTEACLGLVWAVGSLGARPGLNISRSRPPNLCQEAGTGPRRPFMLDFKARRI